ncbi:MAG: DJ-1/PfpI family protein [Clostridiaceae bacterium]|nr:DJ-1/PfpI family protein [Clostridiaceae bacterium]
MAQALIFLAPGYEEVEMLTVVDLLRRADIAVDMVSITDALEVTSSHNVTIRADKLFHQANFDQAEMIILPGGIPGTPNLLAYKPLTEKIQEFAAAKKWLSAICAAPTVYGQLGLFHGCKATCYPGQEKNLGDATYVIQPVVQDDIFITSRGAGTTIEFAAAIIARLKDKKTADTVLEKIIYCSHR